mgnify:FL=1
MRVFLLSLFSFLFAGLSYSQNIDSVILDMPENIIPALSVDNRTMLLVDSTARVIPTVFGEVEKLTYRDDYLKVKTSDVGTIQIKTLDTKNDTYIVCVIKTVCAPACDSDIKFYDSEWEEIDKSTLLPSMTVESFITFKDNQKHQTIYKSLLPDICLIDARFDDTGKLVLKLDVEKYLSGEDLKKFNQTFELKELTFKWDLVSFN